MQGERNARSERAVEWPFMIFTVQFLFRDAAKTMVYVGSLRRVA